ncbi:hypothetical protein [Streptomyces sp. NPDC048612]|uniref:hypothetical protein n=1 Tax=Streptomyces sp. NPDC048612 TaxID=3365579 RepID=UPI00371F6051
MMNFKVDPDHIAGFGKLVGRAADDMRSASSYIDNNTQVGGSLSSFAWDIIGGNHDQTVADAKTTIKGFTEILDASEKELTRSAKYYRATDQKEAAKLDGTYESPSSAREWDEADADLGTVNPSDFTDRSSSTDRLKSTDVDENYFQEWGGEFMLNPVSKAGGTLLDFGSPTGIVTEALKFAGIVDVFDKPVQALGGDWEGYLKASVAWGNIANFCEDVADNIQWGNRSLDESWHGNAAETAWRYFHEIGQKLKGAAESFRSLQQHYDQIARMVYSAAELTKGVIVMICDLAVQAILFNIAMAAALASVYGSAAAPVLEALAMSRVMAALKKYTEMLMILEKLVTGVHAVIGLVFAASAGLCSQVKDFPRPGSGYDHQAV